MQEFQIGDIVTRKSYGGDINFTISDIDNYTRSKPIFVLRGLIYRIEADAYGDDLVKPDPSLINSNSRRYVNMLSRQVHTHYFRRSPLFWRPKAKPGKILHLDSSGQFLEMCSKHYRDAGLEPIGVLASEKQQPSMVRKLLEKHRPDILVLTGHDGFKNGDEKRDSVERYRTSKYFIQGVKEARAYEPSLDKLCIFAGACQSYYEAIISAGANFASSPGRILINALDPAIVSEKIALTDYRTMLTPKEVVRLTISGSKGIGGINTKGRLRWL